jgi:hypothetical protein
VEKVVVKDAHGGWLCGGYVAAICLAR